MAVDKAVWHKKGRVLRFIYLSGKTPSKMNVCFFTFSKYFLFMKVIHFFLYTFLLVVLLLLNLCNLTLAVQSLHMIYIPLKFQSSVLLIKVWWILWRLDLHIKRYTTTKTFLNSTVLDFFPFTSINLQECKITGFHEE